jgi:uncharacterized protein
MKALLVGISTRALAQSAVSAGYETTSLDFFGDSDQPDSARVYVLERELHRPLELKALAEEAQKLSENVDLVIIESGIENEARLRNIGRPEQRNNNTDKAISACRDLGKLTMALVGIDARIPNFVRPGEKLPSSGRWLIKDSRHSGGWGVRNWDGRSLLNPSEILEQFVEGDLSSACFVANGKKAKLLGISRQYAGVNELDSPEYAWCGNVIPSNNPELITVMDRVISKIVESFGLIGINGIDFIYENNALDVLEINPRPPASFELYEYLLRVNLFQMHIDACHGRLPEKLPLLPENVCRGKGILYAKYDVIIRDSSKWKQMDIADIPHSGEFIPAGAPICTIFGDGSNPNDCWHKIIKKAEILKKLIY